MELDEQQQYNIMQGLPISNNDKTRTTSILWHLQNIRRQRSCRIANNIRNMRFSKYTKNSNQSIINI